MDMPKTQYQELIQAVGIMSEMSWLYFVNLKKLGFTPAQSLELTKAYMLSIMNKPQSNYPTSDGLPE